MKKNILISGGTSGIGLGIVQNLAETKEYNIISVSRDMGKVDNVKKQLGSHSKDILFLKCDITQSNDCDIVATEIENQFGELHGLVNCAGTINSGGIEECNYETWSNVIKTNLTGTFLLTNRMVPFLKKSKSAAIVNVSSVCSLKPCSSIAYSVSKAGTDMFTKCLAQELAKYSIRVNSVNPGVVRSNLQISAGIVENYEDFIKKMAPLHPLGRIGTPEDISHMVTFLLSENASWITGAIISVDGGRAL